MGRPTWASETQYNWLCVQGEKYKAIQAQKKNLKDSGTSGQLPSFWPIFLAEWSAQWPTPALSDIIKSTPQAEAGSNATVVGGNSGLNEPSSVDEAGDNSTVAGNLEQLNIPSAVGSHAKAANVKKARGPLTMEGRIRDFIHNYVRKVLGKDSKPTKLDLSGKKKNKWQHSQAYSHLYYHSKLKAIVDEEYAEYCTSLPLDVEPEKIFTWRNRRVRELYENESDDVKAEVEELRNKSTPSTKEMKAVDDMLQEGLPFNVIQASMRKRRLSALPHTVTTQMNEIAVQTGMMGLFVLAGQDPDSPEDIVIMVFQTGQTAQGQSFKDTHRDFVGAIRDPMSSFAHKCIFVDKSFAEFCSLPQLEQRDDIRSSSAPAASHGNTAPPTSETPPAEPNTSTSAATIDLNRTVFQPIVTAQGMGTGSTLFALDPALEGVTVDSPPAQPSKADSEGAADGAGNNMDVELMPTAQGASTGSTSTVLEPALEGVTVDSLPVQSSMVDSGGAGRAADVAGNNMDVDVPNEAGDRGSARPDDVLQPIHGNALNTPSTQAEKNNMTYEEERKRNIERNMALRLSLGIDSALEELQALRKSTQAKEKENKKPAASKPRPKPKPKPKRKTKGKGGRKANNIAESSTSNESVDNAGGPENVEGTHQSHQTSQGTLERSNAVPSNSSIRSSSPDMPSSSHVALVDTKKLLSLASSAQRSWMSAGLETLVSVFGPPQKDGIIDLWLQFEILIGYNDMKKVKLAPQGRPWQVAEWMARRRRYDRPPPIERAADYGLSWKEWWMALQPEWRCGGNSWPLIRRDGGNQNLEGWPALLKGGENGVFLILLSASWWMQKADDEEKKICQEAIDDMRWALQQMMEMLRNRGGGGESGDIEEDAADRPRKRARRS